MQTGSAKHGPRLDDQLERQAREQTRAPAGSGRGRERRRPEPAPDDELDIPPVERRDLDGGAQLTMTEDDIDERSRLGTYLPRTVFPADRAALIKAAKAAKAPDDILAKLRRLPQGVTFSTAARVWAALGHPTNHRF